MTDDEYDRPYYKRSGVEAIDVIEAMVEGSPNARIVDFLRAQVLKYLWRLGMKGNAREDAGKARWYLQRMISHLESNAHFNHAPATSSTIYPLSRAELDEREDRAAPKPIAPVPAAPVGPAPCARREGHGEALRAQAGSAADACDVCGKQCCGHWKTGSVV